MLKKLLLVLVFSVLVGCYNGDDIFDKIMNSNLEFDYIYEEPDGGGMSYIATKGEEIFFIQGYSDTGNIDVYKLAPLNKERTVEIQVVEQ